MQPESQSLVSHFYLVLPGGQDICELAPWEGLQLPGGACVFGPLGLIGALPTGLGLSL